MSGDHTHYSVTAYWPAPAGFQEVDSLLRGFGFQRDQDAPHAWQTGECLDDLGVEIAEELRAVAVRHRFAFEVVEEATDFDMGRRYTYLPDQDVLHQTTVGNDRNDYLLVQQVWEAIDQTTTREELVQTLETTSGRHIERGLQVWRHDHRGPPANP
jgi:hypothetical protein